MNDIYVTEIQPLLSTMQTSDIDLLMYNLCNEFVVLKESARKKHFGGKTDSEMRSHAIATAAYCLAIVKNLDNVSLDGKEETEETK